MEEILDQLKPGDVNVSRVTPLVVNCITYSHIDYLTFQFKLVLSEDGSGKGAAAIAAAEALYNLPD